MLSIFASYIRRIRDVHLLKYNSLSLMNIKSILNYLDSMQTSMHIAYTRILHLILISFAGYQVANRQPFTPSNAFITKQKYKSSLEQHFRALDTRPEYSTTRLILIVCTFNNNIGWMSRCFIKGTLLVDFRRFQNVTFLSVFHQVYFKVWASMKVWLVLPQMNHPKLIYQENLLKLKTTRKVENFLIFWIKKDFNFFKLKFLKNIKLVEKFY